LTKVFIKLQKFKARVANKALPGGGR